MNLRLKPYPEYKDSSQPWLDKVPRHWQEKRAKYLFREVDERSETGDEELLSVSHVTGVTPRRQKNVTMFKAESYAGHKLCRPGDLVINTMWAWMSALGVAKEPGIVSPAYGVYRPRHRDVLMASFADDLLRTDSYRSEYLCRSTGIRASRLRLYPEKFLEIAIPYPPREEQEKILAFLKAKNFRIQRLINAKRRLIKLLDEQKQVIIHRAVTRGLDPDVRLKASGVDWLGDVPEHWEVCRLRNVISRVTSGSRGWSDYAADDGPLFLRVGNLTRGTIELKLEDIVRLNLPETAEAHRTRVQAGDVLISITAYIGSVAVVPHDLAEAYVSQHIALCRPRGQQHSSRWLAYVLLSPVGQTHGQISLYGGTKDGLALDDVKSYPILLPPRPEQDLIVKHLDSTLDKINCAQRATQDEVDFLREYRTRLVADVVTGKLDVRGVELPELEEIEDSEGYDVDDAEEEADPGLVAEG